MSAFVTSGQTTVSNLVQLPFRIYGEGHERSFEYQDLFDCGSTSIFGSKSFFVDKLGFKPSDKCVTVKNGDDSSQLSMVRSRSRCLLFVILNLW